MTLEDAVAAAEDALKAVVDASDEGAPEEVVARAKALRDFMAGDGTDEEPKTEGEGEGARADELTADEDAENAGLEASARSYGAEFETKVKRLRGLKAKPSVIRSALVQDVAASAVTTSRSASPKAADIEPRRDGASAVPVIDTASIYERANNRFNAQRAKL